MQHTAIRKKAQDDASQPAWSEQQEEGEAWRLLVTYQEVQDAGPRELEAPATKQHHQRHKTAGRRGC